MKQKHVHKYMQCLKCTPKFPQKLKSMGNIHATGIAPFIGHIYKWPKALKNMLGINLLI